jgi:uncharacterized membrane protein
MEPPRIIERFGRACAVPPMVRAGSTVVAINVGGALIPVLVSIYPLIRTRMPLRLVTAVAVVAAIVHSLAEIVPGVGDRRMVVHSVAQHRNFLTRRSSALYVGRNG